VFIKVNYLYTFTNNIPMWIPKWLGEAYAKMYNEFHTNLFTFNDAKKILGYNESKVKIILSRLHDKGILMIFERKRPRIYRLISSENFLLLASDKIRKLNIRQERYLQLIYDCFRSLNRIVNLESLILYGSIARGDAKANSDLDLLVVSDDFHGSIGSRIEFLLMNIKPMLRDELNFLRRHGYNVFLSFYPLRCNEIYRFPIFLLDLIDDAKIIYDKNNFFEKFLLEFKLKIMGMNARKIKSKHGWIWILRGE